MSGDLTGQKMTSPPRLCLVSEIPNWSHTGLNLTNPLRADLVVIGRVKSGNLTGLGWIRSDLDALPNWSFKCS